MHLIAPSLLIVPLDLLLRALGLDAHPLMYWSVMTLLLVVTVSGILMARASQHVEVERESVNNH